MVATMTERGRCAGCHKLADTFGETLEGLRCLSCARDANTTIWDHCPSCGRWEATINGDAYRVQQDGRLFYATVKAQDKARFEAVGFISTKPVESIGLGYLSKWDAMDACARTAGLYPFQQVTVDREA